MKRIARLLVGVSALLALTGCVVHQTRSGDFQFGFIEPGSTISQFQSANGLVRVRRHFDGNHSIRFSDRLTVYNLPRANSWRVVEVLNVPGKTAVLLQGQKNNCSDYELLTITNGNVEKSSIGGCARQPMDVSIRGDQLVVSEPDLGNNLRTYWVWSPTGIKRDKETFKERPHIQHPLNPYYRDWQRQQAAQQQQEQARQHQAQRQVATSRTRASAQPSVRNRPASARAPEPIVIPSGSVTAEEIQSTRVILTRDGG